MKNVYWTIGFVFTCILAVAIIGCMNGDEDDPKAIVDPNVKEAIVAFESVNPKSGSTIRVNSEITITFNEKPENVSINNGKIVLGSNNLITIKGPFDPGELVLEVKWKGGSENLKYNVEGAIFSTVTPSVGLTITPFTDIIVTFKGKPERVEVSHGTFIVSGSTVTISGPFRELGLFPLKIKWADGSEVLTYGIIETPIANIKDVWVDHNVFIENRKSMRIHVEFDAWYMQNHSGELNAYFYFADGDQLKDFNGKFVDGGGGVAASGNFTPRFLYSIYRDFTIDMPYDELHFNNKGEWDLMFVLQIYDHQIDRFIHVSESKVYFSFRK